MPDTLTITAVLVAVLSGELKSFASNKGFDMRPVVAGFLLGVFLYILQEVNESLFKAFAVLIIITAVVVNGNGIANALTVQKVK